MGRMAVSRAKKAAKKLGTRVNVVDHSRWRLWQTTSTETAVCVVSAHGAEPRDGDEIDLPFDTTLYTPVRRGEAGPGRRLSWYVDAGIQDPKETFSQRGTRPIDFELSKYGEEPYIDTVRDMLSERAHCEFDALTIRNRKGNDVKLSEILDWLDGRGLRYPHIVLSFCRGDYDDYVDAMPWL